MKAFCKILKEKEFVMIIDHFIGNKRESKKITILAFSLEKAKKKIPPGWKMYQFMGVTE